MKYKDLDVIITFDKEESEKHIEADYNTLINEGIDKIIKEQFISWLLGEQFNDKDIDKVFEGMKAYEVSYHYGKIVANYSPTNEENYFGQFEFCFESCNDYTKDIFEAVAMQIYVLNGSVVKVSGYDI
jgi:hypothetical protein